MDSSDSISVGLLDRTYVLHTPVSSSALRALLLVFHGGGGQGRGMARLTHFDEIADREGFVVAYPDGFRRLWAARRLFAQGVDDIGFVSALINKLTNEHHIDPSKVYAAGISNGGFFLQSLAFELPGEIKALATVAATMPIAFAEAQSLTRPVSVMLIHGTQDPLVPFEGGRVRAGARGRILSAPDSAVKWAQLNGCSTNQTVSYLRNRVEDSTRIRVENWASGLENSEVLMYVVEGCGHTWPGGWQYLPERVIGKTTRNLDASEEIVAFFKRH